MKQGWTYKQLKDVTNKISDGSHNPPKGIAYSEYPMLSSKNILFDDFNYDSPRYLSKEDFDIENKRTDISDGDVLLTIVGTVGRTCCVQNPFIPFTLQRSVAVLKPKKEILISRFLMYALYSLSDLWENEAKGAAQKGVYLKQLAAVSIPTPPISEQERIVERLDAAFAQIDELKSNAERQLAEARALFQAALTQAMQPKPGWQEKKLSDICDVINGLWKGKKPPYIKVGVIRNANFTKSFTLRYDNIEYLDVEVRQYEKRKLQKGDLIVEKSGGSEKQPVGRAVLFEREDGEFSFSNFTSILRIKDKNTFLSKFLYYFLLFIYKRGDTFGMQRATTGIHNIEFEKYLNIGVPVLSLSEQQCVVDYLDALSKIVCDLEEISSKTAAECDTLKQALLRQIFE